MIRRLIRGSLTRLGVYAANMLAFLVLIVYAALWIAFKPETLQVACSGHTANLGHDVGYSTR